MAEPLPGLAASSVAKLLTGHVKRPDGMDATAFNDQAKGLTAMRTRVMSLEERLERLEAATPPFPFRDSSSPGG